MRGKAEIVAAPAVPVPAPPAKLAQGVQRAWSEVTESLASSALIDAVDLHAVEVLSHVIARWRVAEERLVEDGHFLVHPNGHVYLHPAVKMAEKAENDFVRWCEKFGLTPKDRIGLGLDVMRGQQLAAEIDDEPPLKRKT